MVETDIPVEPFDQKFPHVSEPTVQLHGLIHDLPADFVAGAQRGFRTRTRLFSISQLVERKGYPVLVEKGYYEEDYTGKVAWLGHYLFTTGYDEAKQEFIVQDAYLKPGADMSVDYPSYLEGWRSFNYLFIK